MAATDRLTPELRNIEAEIDCLYKSNPLVNLPFATAAWHLLATAEDEMIRQRRQVARLNGINDVQLLSTEFATNLEYSMSWLYCDCNPGGQIPSVYDDNLSNTSLDLLKLGKNYASFVFAFTCASRGVFELDPQGSTIQPIGNWFDNLEYMAYNYFIARYHAQKPLSVNNHDENFR